MNSDRRVCKAIFDCKQSNPEVTEPELLELVSQALDCDKGVAKSLVAVFEAGFKAGVNSVVTSGLSDHEHTFGQDPLFDSAHAFGRKTFKKMSRPTAIRHIQLVVVVVLLGVAVYFFFR